MCAEGLKCRNRTVSEGIGRSTQLLNQLLPAAELSEVPGLSLSLPSEQRCRTRRGDVFDVFEAQAPAPSNVAVQVIPKVLWMPGFNKQMQIQIKAGMPLGCHFLKTKVKRSKVGT